MLKRKLTKKGQSKSKCALHMVINTTNRMDERYFQLSVKRKRIKHEARSMNFRIEKPGKWEMGQDRQPN